MEGPWGDRPSEPTAVQPPASFARVLLANLRAGFRVARFNSVGRRQFVTTGGQVLASLVVVAILLLGYTFLVWRDSENLPRALQAGWFEMLAVSFISLLLAAYLISLATGLRGGLRTLGVISVSSMLMPLGVLLVLGAEVDSLARYLDRSDAFSWLYHVPYIALTLAAIWCLTTLARSLRVTCLLTGMLPAFLSLFLIGAFFAPLMFDWRHTDDEAVAAIEDDESPIPYDLDVEETFYAQPSRVDRAVALTEESRRGVTDLYFVGFGSYATQNVFRSEVEKVSALFADRFDTAGRSVELINHADTVSTQPIASVSNLRRLLSGLAGRMDRDEDVLFLFLTSHGSEGILSVDFYPLELNSLRADELDRMLEAAGIKWRVIVVSACYSGSFIEPLKDENSLIITASRRDRTSFGCSNENEYTYFGDAYFNQALRRERDFIAGFEQARKTIAAREAAEDLTPSEPQIHVGAAIRERLKELESRLNSVNAAASNYGG
jgi:hypothetical protein